MFSIFILLKSTNEVNKAGIKVKLRDEAIILIDTNI